MATEKLSAGVFVEEIPSSVQVVQAVSTSNVGAVGFTPKGPTEEATLVTSFTQFTDKFGSFTPNGLLPLQMAAFFANGGKRAFINRVVPSDAVEAEGYLESQILDQQIEAGDGGTAVFTEAAPQTADLTVNGGDTPIVPGTWQVRWRAAATPVTAQTLRNRADSANVALVNGTAKYEARIAAGSIPSLDSELDAVVPGTATLVWNPDGVGDRSLALNTVQTGTITVTNVQGTKVVFDHRTGLLSVFFATTDIPGAGATGNLRLTFTPATATFVAGDSGVTGGALKDITNRGLAFAKGTITTVAKASLIDGETFTISDGTTAVVFEFDDNGVTTPGNVPILLGSLVTADDVRDAIVTAVTGVPDFNVSAISGGAATVTLSNDFPGTTGNVAITDTVANVGFTHTGMAGGANSTLTYDTGAYSITFDSTAIPHNLARILASYKNDAWQVKPLAPGLWGNDLRIAVTGSASSQVTATGLFTKFNINILQRNSVNTSTFDIKETYEDLVFDDPTSPSFFADVLNELSDLVSIVEPGADVAIGQLQTSARSQVVAGGDESSGGKTITATLGDKPAKKRTVVISFTGVSSGVLTVTDDGNGNLIGAVDATGNNAITYGSTTVAPTIDVKLSEAIKAGTLVTVAYYSGPAETTHTETLGDTSKKVFKAAVVRSWLAGTDGTFTSGTYGRDQISNPALQPTKEGVYALDLVEELMQVIVPDFVGNTTITGDLIDMAESHALSASGGDRFLIIQPPKGLNAQQAVDWLRFDLNRQTKWAACYWPHVKVADPLSPIGAPVVVPAVGHIAGIYARTDATRSVGKAPAGTVDGKLNFLLGLETNPGLDDRNLVYPANINPLISSSATGLAVWGSRTIASVAEQEWRQVNARRTFMFVEKSIYNSTFWVAFENNGPSLWDKLKTQINGFLKAQFDIGLFAGKTPAQAFFVICDSTNNDPNSNTVNCRIGLATNKPAEFVVFEFQQVTV